MRKSGKNINSDNFHYYLYCLDALTGEKSWQFEIIGIENMIETTETTAYLEIQGYQELSPFRHMLRTEGKNKTFIWTMDDLTAKLTAVDLSTGKRRWSIPDAHFLGTSQKLTYIQQKDGTVAAVETETGKILYTYNVPKDVTKITNKPAIQK